MSSTIPRLHQRYPQLESSLPHLALGISPTPVRRLSRLEDGAQGEIWLKDDSFYGEGGWGGNKVRKLEWVIPDALRRRRSALITVGGLGTNFGLATAIYGRQHGLRTIIALTDQPVDDHVSAQLERLERSGARLYRTGTTARTRAAMPWLRLRHTHGGRLPYALPVGGSSPVGTLGYVEAGLEIAEQIHAGDLPRPHHIVVALGSGGTAAGLLLGLRIAGIATRVVAVAVNDRLNLDQARVHSLAERSHRLLCPPGVRPYLSPPSCEVTVTRAYLGPGYGYGTPEAAGAQARALDAEGLELEPVYTAKAMAALLGMRANGELGTGPALFLNTYGPRPDRPQVSERSPIMIAAGTTTYPHWEDR